MMPTTISDDSLKNSLAVSAGLHLLFLLLLFFGLPSLFKPLPTYHPPVPFEIVEIADLTNTRVKEPEEQQKTPEPPPQPAAKTQVAETPPQPPAPPAPPKPLERSPENVEALMPKPEKKPLEKPKPTQQAFASVLKNLEKMKPTIAAKTPDTKTPSKSQQQANSQAPSLSDRLTISEEDALRRQISQCWNMPIGARDAQNLIVEVTINVNPDRTVQSADVVDKGRMASDSFYRAAAEAALRALNNPKCSPLELPADKYDQWKTIDFTFDPRDML